jgi:gliding motility-associated-like protein
MKYFHPVPLSIILTIILNVTFQSIYGQSQSTCPNSNFSLGDFTDWHGYYGYVGNPANTSGFSSDRHTIINTPGTYDPHTCYGLFTLPPGETHCAKLGNDDSDAEAEQLRYTIAVTPETNLFIYKYAVVLEDPGHDPQEQPSFTIEVADNSGNLIDPECGYYYVYAQQGLPTWHSCDESGVIWKDWTTVGIDLSPYTGQSISIVFTTRDCSLGAHYGYAYISAYCSKLEIVFGYCPNDTVATVSAPPGFTYLWANGDTNQISIIHNPYFGLLDSCTLTSVNGCKVTTQGRFQPTLVNADFNFEPVCFGTPVSFTNSSTINQNVITDWTWDFGDGSPLVPNVQNPQHNYDKIGTYEITLSARSTDGCPDTITKSTQIGAIPVAEFTPSYTCSRKTTNDTIYFDGEVRIEVPHDCDSYIWNTGDSTWSIQVTTEGWYKVTLENAGICIITDSVMMMDCYVPLSMPNAFTPNNDGLNDNFRPVTKPEKIFFFKMTVYDRWGMQIFTTRDVRKGWDGKINGSDSPIGVYMYNIAYENPAGDKLTDTGIVTLVR